MPILACSLVFYCLVLAGCSSDAPGIPNIYLMSLSYQSSNAGDNVGINKDLRSTFERLAKDAQLIVRTSYFGMCISTTDGAHWACSRETTVLSSGLNSDQDPLDLILIAALFRDNIVFSGLMYGDILVHKLSTCLLSP